MYRNLVAKNNQVPQNIPQNRANHHPLYKNYVMENMLYLRRKKICYNPLMTVEQILQEVALMPAPMRAFIAEKILETLDFEEQINLSPEWMSLIQQRISDIDDGIVQMVGAEEALNQIWSELE
jgi:hypothetical protein